MEKENGQQPKKDLKQAYRTAYLVAGHIRQTLTKEEQDELDAWIAASDGNKRFFEQLINEQNMAGSVAAFGNTNVEQGLSETKKNLEFAHPRKVARIWQYSIAASLLIAAGLFFYYRFSGSSGTKEIIAVQATDIAPGSDKATLTLENGKVIVLDNKGADTSLNSQIQVLRNSGEIVYNNESPEKETVYHTLTIPRKGHYQLVLPDGTQVWLNAESSIKFPTAFNGKERRVFVTGETFFHVAKNKEKPFRAVAGEMTVEALGTQFNINAYSNEPYVATTLVEGSVKVSAPQGNELLMPGEQSQLAGSEMKKTKVNPEDVIAWKNNEFQFHNTALDVIMRQIERWYDAKVIYKDEIKLHLNATIGRNVPVSKLLHILEETGQVHFEIDGSTITVMK